MWREAKSGDGRVYYYHSETRETKWVKPDELVEAIGKLSTKKERVEAVREQFSRNPNPAELLEKLAAHAKTQGDEDFVRRFKRGLAALYVVDSILRRKTPEAKALAAECARGKLAEILRCAADVFDGGNDEERLKVRDAANATVFLVNVWEKKKCIDVTGLKEALEPLRWKDDRLTATVVSLPPYGCFLRADDGKEGLLHRNEMRGQRFQRGDRVDLKVIGSNAEGRHKFALPDHRADASSKHHVPVPPRTVVVDVNSTVRKINWSPRGPPPKKTKRVTNEPFEVKSYDQIIAEKKQKAQQLSSSSSSSS
ncbi:hypothetical protein CTAYLR_002613 [Chrysophaeum taylorii]|uniref:WW domain-containing protein n=1 Tax=Chrysophaeum taylorii TaxID=2483200 RepID=A0AAD7UD52_9STRA|nr:hypothetical protein CTAYLR_002613 [Chrysophaeum taylorii]